MTTDLQRQLLVRVLREDLTSSALSATENRVRHALFRSGLLGWNYEDEERTIDFTEAGKRALDDVSVLFAPPRRYVGKAVDVEQERILHVCAASQYGTTQEALCGYAPEHGRGWDFPTALEIAVLTTCPDCWNEKGAKKVY